MKTRKVHVAILGFFWRRGKMMGRWDISMVLMGYKTMNLMEFFMRFNGINDQYKYIYMYIRMSSIHISWHVVGYIMGI